MSDKPAAQKLLLKQGYTFLLLNPPKGYSARMGKLPPKVKVLTAPGEPADVIQVFYSTQAELEKDLAALKPALKPRGVLWITYPKGTSRLASDLNRDTIWKFAATVGLAAVAIFSVDEDWSALRLKLAP